MLLPHFIVVLFLSFVFGDCQNGQPNTLTSTPRSEALNPESVAISARPADALHSGCNSFVVESHKQPCLEQLPPLSDCPHLAQGMISFPTSLSNGQDVEITQRTLFTSCQQPAAGVVLGTVHIRAGGALVFNDEDDLHLHAREIRVDSGGELLAGSPTCPLFGKLTFHLHGNKAQSSLELSDTSSPSKGIVNYGHVSLVGERFSPTWTRLAATVEAGGTELHVQDPTNWHVGGALLVTTSTFYDCPDKWLADDFCKPCFSWQTCDPQPHQNELRSIRAISDDRRTLVLDSPLQYQHWSERAYQIEVALLSRNIVIRDGDLPEDADIFNLAPQSADEFGAHFVSTLDATMHVAGVQCSHCGQLNVEGRYPFHMHLLNDGAASYFEDNSVIHSNFRGYVVHGTNSSRLSRNIAYNVNGNTFYIEDGVEENNLLEYNLAAHVHPIFKPAEGSSQGGEVRTRMPDLLVPADITAAGFYVTNAYNRYIGNAASGGWSGFGFPNTEEPLGLFANEARSDHTNPHNRPTLEFKGNSAHSAGFYWQGAGSCIYTGGKLNNDNGMWYDSGRHSRSTRNPDGSAAWMVFEDTRTFLCNKGIAHWGDRLDIVRFESADNIVAAMTFGESSLQNVLVTGRTTNRLGWETSDKSFYNPKYCFQFYDTWVKSVLKDVTCQNFTEAEDFALASMTHSDQFLPQGINAVRGISFVDVPHENTLQMDNCGPDCGTEYTTMSSKIYSIWDFDGTVSKTGKPTLIGGNSAWWRVDGLPSDGCKHDTDLHSWMCDWTENSDIGYVQIEVPDLIDECDRSVPTASCDGQKAEYTVGVVSQWGRPDHSITMSPWSGVAGITGTGWLFRPKCDPLGIDGAPSEFQIGNGFQLRRGQFIVLAVAYPAQVQPSDVTVRLTSGWWNDVNELLQPADETTVKAPRETLAPYQQFSCPGGRWNSFCDFSSSGGSGPSYYFDTTDSMLYIRVVNIMCYNKGTLDDCEDLTTGYQRQDVQIPSITSAFRYEVSVNCAGCSVQSTHGAVTYYNAPDNTPAAFPVERGPVRETPAFSQTTLRPCLVETEICGVATGLTQPPLPPQQTLRGPPIGNQPLPTPTGGAAPQPPPEGGLGQDCRSSQPACDDPLECSPSQQRCVPVGAVGEQCRAAAPQCDGTLECNSQQLCVLTGLAGYACRLSEPSCEDGLECNANSVCAQPEGSCEPGSSGCACEEGDLCSLAASQASSNQRVSCTNSLCVVEYVEQEYVYVPPVTTDGNGQGTDTPWLLPAILGGVGALVLIALVVTMLVCISKRKKRDAAVAAYLGQNTGVTTGGVGMRGSSRVPGSSKRASQNFNRRSARASRTAGGYAPLNNAPTFDSGFGNAYAPSQPSSTMDSTQFSRPAPPRPLPAPRTAPPAALPPRPLPQRP